MARILVTGGSGFLGGNLVSFLGNRGHDVTILDCLAPTTGGIAFLKHDLRSLGDLAAEIDGYEIVIHLAATSDTRASSADFRVDLDNSVSCSWNLVEAIRKTKTVKCCFLSSSQHVYGRQTGAWQSEESLLHPISSYGAAKVACEAIFSACSSSNDTSSVIGRISNIVGKGQNYGVLVDFINRLKTNPHELRIWGNGSQQRNFLHVSDLCTAITLLIERPWSGGTQIFNLANTSSLTVRRVAEIVVQEMQLPNCRITFESENDAGWCGDPGSLRPSVTRIQSLGWQPRFDCEAAVRQAVLELT